MKERKFPSFFAAFLVRAAFVLVAVGYSGGLFPASAQENPCDNDTETPDCIRFRAEQGDAKAQSSLGSWYLRLGVQTDPQQAALWFRKAAEQGDAEAQINLAALYSVGAGVEKDPQQAAQWFRKAAEQGHASAQMNLGMLYYNGTGVEKDRQQAALWFRKAAEQGFAKAQYNLGFIYYYGIGVVEDKRKAYIWGSIANASGSKSAADIMQKIPWHEDLTPDEIESAKQEAARRLEAIRDKKTEE